MRRRAAWTAAALAICGAVAGGCGGDKPPAARTVHTTTTRVEVVRSIGTAGGSFDPQAIYAKEAPGVVTIISVFGGGSLTDLLSGGGGGGASGLGSGIVLDGKGEIATNAHVVTTGEGRSIAPARRVFVAFADGNRVPARIRGYDPDADVALLTIDPQGLKLNPLPLGDSGAVKVGVPVAAMGSPFGEEQSLSVGVVSAVDRDIDSLTDFAIPGAIQTDAAINPGNSGGPLVDARGRVIGLNQQIKSESGGGEGVGFAVPVNLVKRSIAQLRETGHARYAYFGVAGIDVYPQLAERFHLPVERGVWVQDATAGGPAAKAGIRGSSGRATFQADTLRTGGDVIVSVDGRPVAHPSDLAQAVVHHDPGDRVAVVLYRNGTKKTVTVTLGRRPARVAGAPGR